MRVVNVAVTQGSNKAAPGRRGGGAARPPATTWASIWSRPRLAGSSGSTSKTREQDPAHWRASVDVDRRDPRRAAARRRLLPARQRLEQHAHRHAPSARGCAGAAGRRTSAVCVVETEFWGAMATPNLMVESSVDDVAEMMAALSFHVGEVQRNPYHLLCRPWMQDNVRRGGELVGGQGGAAPDFTFCTLYRFRRWNDAQVRGDLRRRPESCPRATTRRRSALVGMTQPSFDWRPCCSTWTAHSWTRAPSSSACGCSGRRSTISIRRPFSPSRTAGARWRRCSWSRRNWRRSTKPRGSTRSKRQQEGGETPVPGAGELLLALPSERWAVVTSAP